MLIIVRFYTISYVIQFFFPVHFKFCSLLVLSSEDVLPAVYLCTNKIAADHENMVLLLNFILCKLCSNNANVFKFKIYFYFYFIF